MKITLGVIALCSVLVLGCNNQEEELQKQIGQLQTEKSTLEQSIVDRNKEFDEIMLAVNDVYTNIEVARTKEAKLVEKTEGAEGAAQLTTVDSRQKLMQNISAIGAALKENKKTIASLQSKIKTYRGEFASLNKVIEDLKTSVQEREKSIALFEARVQGLEATVAEKIQVINEKDGIIENQKSSMNTAYYIVGTRDELEAKGVIQDVGGILGIGSTTILASGVDRSLFTPVDRTKDQTIHITGQIDEIVPRRSEDLFATASPDEMASDLTITHPGQFWQDNYLVIVVD